MKKNISRQVFFLFCLFLLFPLILHAQKNLFPRQEFRFREIETLSVDGKFRATLIPSQQERVLVMLDEEDLKGVSVEQKGKELVIRGKKKILEDLPPVPVRIEYVKLDKIRMSGMAHVVIPESLRSMNLDIRLQDESVLQGSFLVGGKACLELKDKARLEGRIDVVRKGTVVVGDMAEVRIRGYIPELELKMTDMGRFFGPELLSDKADARLSEVSEARWTVNRQLKARVEDAARLSYGGQPEVSVSGHGSATVSALD